MLILNFAILVAAILLLAFALAPGVRAGTVNRDLAAGGVALIIALAPILFVVTGVMKVSLPFLAVAALVLFLITYLGGRRMVTSILGSIQPRDR